MVIVTSTTAAHLPRSKLMAKSVKQHMPQCKVIIGLMEENLPYPHWNLDCCDEIVLIKNTGIYPNFHKFIFQYKAAEGAGTGKAQILKYACQKYESEEIFVYLDTDMKVYGPFEELQDIFRDHSIVITPHLIHFPEPLSLQQIKNIKFHGIYNAGFVAIKRDQAAIKFLDWWIRQIEHHGYIDSEIFGDQSWIDFVPPYFDNVYILRHPGYNTAFWNYHERTASISGDQILIDGLPLRCFHFSHYNSTFVHVIRTLREDQQNYYNKLRNDYANELGQIDIGYLSGTRWSYDCFSSGEPIKDQTREVYRMFHHTRPDISNPFLLSNSFFGQ
ncbi:hypothetical protein ACFSL6_18195 [Paenibacillus thailandensis]|uniref:Glycosyl transferase n=1 Tax=Paenibacillus thailandensis TaxID=393250 RepID=A0ABW5QRP3_9BACL